jgi:hypothetical protein
VENKELEVKMEEKAIYADENVGSPSKKKILMSRWNTWIVSKLKEIFDKQFASYAS